MFHVKQFTLALAAICAISEAAGQGKHVQIPGEGVMLTGLYFIAEGPKPTPAIIMLHGCSGLLDTKGKPNASYLFWAEHFQNLGYSTLLLDSFSSRGAREICTQRDRHIRPDIERRADAHAALEWMGTQAGVDRAAIHLMGWSNGAMAVLHAIKERASGSKSDLRFRSAAAFYPGCAAMLQEPGFEILTPLLIQTGGADDWTPAKYCQDLAAVIAKNGGVVEIDVYAGAHHSFDRIGLSTRFRPDVRNANRPDGRGATIGTHAAARAAAIAKTTAFFASQNERR